MLFGVEPIGRKLGCYSPTYNSRLSSRILEAGVLQPVSTSILLQMIRLVLQNLFATQTKTLAYPHSDKEFGWSVRGYVNLKVLKALPQ